MVPHTMWGTVSPAPGAEAPDREARQNSSPVYAGPPRLPAIKPSEQKLFWRLQSRTGRTGSSLGAIAPATDTGPSIVTTDKGGDEIPISAYSAATGLLGSVDTSTRTPGPIVELNAMRFR